jgi:hypothetical protein
VEREAGADREQDTAGAFRLIKDKMDRVGYRWQDVKTKQPDMND